MRTPRELLLTRHQDKVHELDAMRREVIAKGVCPRAQRDGAPSSRNSILPPGWLQVLWLELVSPHRRAWTALAATWVLIAGLHAFTDHGPEVRGGDIPPPSAEMRAILEQQRQLRAELLGVTRESIAAAKPRLPRPRTEVSPNRQETRREDGEGSFGFATQESVMI